MCAQIITRYSNIPHTQMNWRAEYIWNGHNVLKNHQIKLFPIRKLITHMKSSLNNMYYVIMKIFALMIFLFFD